MVYSHMYMYAPHIAIVGKSKAGKNTNVCRGKKKVCLISDALPTCIYVHVHVHVHALGLTYYMYCL